MNLYESEIKFVQDLHREGKKFCIVLTKIDTILLDNQIQLERQITPEEEIKIIEMVKLNFKKKLETYSLASDVYALSALMSKYNNIDNRNKYEFKTLEEKILNILLNYPST